MKMFLIDGNSFCYRAFYAIRELSNSRGEPTNAVYGFVTMLRKLIRDDKPDYLAVAFDMKAPTFRHTQYEKYKIHRKPMPDLLVAQLPVIKEMIRAYRIPVFEKEGFEADDILATLATQFASPHLSVYIVTGDKDALQLVNRHIKVYSPHKEGVIYDRARVKKRYGVYPEQMVDLLALMGDSSDNIPGVPGVGPKTAVTLLSAHESLETLLANPEAIERKPARALMQKYGQSAILSRDLATLRTNVPIEASLDEMAVSSPDTESLADLFKRLEFKKLSMEYAPTTSFKTDYRLIEKKKECADFVSTIRADAPLCLDFETTGTNPLTARPIGIAFSQTPGHAVFIRFSDPAPAAPAADGAGIPCEWALSKLSRLFEDAHIQKVGQNIKYEYLILKRYGITLAGIDFDTMIASYLLEPSKLNHNLDDIALNHLNYRMIAIEELIGKGKHQTTLDKVDTARVSEYACEDADITLRLSHILMEKLEKKNLTSLFRDVEMPLVAVLAEMEHAGVALDTALLKEMSGQMASRITAIEAQIHEMAGCAFNINSPQQLSKILFDNLKLPVIKRTKTGISTEESVLRKLSHAHPVVQLLLEYRSLTKLKSTYIDALPQLIVPRTGRLHTSFNQTTTATGRLSSSGPNLQNIPVKTKEGRQIRRAFIPSEKDMVFIAADYSQIELRILAHLSGDKNMIDAFKKSKDIHTHTASLIFDVKEKDVTRAMRNQAKAVNFGIVYGISAFGLSRDLGIEVSRAADFIDNYFSRYPEVKKFLDTQIEEARQKGYSTTILNRRRYLPELQSPKTPLRQFAERAALNTPIQGSAADLIKVAMLSIASRFHAQNFPCTMLLQVHDELIFETRRDTCDAAIEIIRHEMEHVFALRVPVTVTMGTGDNWLLAGKD